MTADYRMPDFEGFAADFKLGWEAGMLWSVLAGPVESSAERHEYLLHLANTEVIHAIAVHTGWAYSLVPSLEFPQYVTATFVRPEPSKPLRLVPRGAP